MTTPIKMRTAPWAICIFASRENLATLIGTLKAACETAQSDAGIDVIVNGNEVLADEIVAYLESPSNTLKKNSINVWSIAFGDKANAWNQYFHSIWNHEELVFFIDGYVQLHPNSIQQLGNAVIKDEKALGGSAVPSIGFSAKRLASIMEQKGGFHGNFCCLKANFLHEIRKRNFHIPIGMYRTDSLVGAMLYFALEPGSRWNLENIHINRNVSWTTPPKSWWKPSDIKAYAKRLFRQARGILENEAIKYNLIDLTKSVHELPFTAPQLIEDWISNNPEKFHKLKQSHPLIRFAIAPATTPLTFDNDSLSPKIIFKSKINSNVE